MIKSGDIVAAGIVALLFIVLLYCSALVGLEKESGYSVCYTCEAGKK